MFTNAMNRQGFTLLELAVVLGIIVIITHLAVREAGQWRASQLHALSDKGLSEIRDAILGGDFERDTEGARVRTGFLADMGRLPQAITNAEDRLTLSELWLRPASAAETYGVRAAVASNLVDEADSADADSDVQVPCGWHGPYLRLPFGKTRLLDAWGNAYETPDDASYTARLRTFDNGLISASGTTVVFIRHLGADGAPDDVTAPASAEDDDGVLNLFATYGADGITNASLTVTVNAYDSDGTPASGTYTGTARVYGPFGGKIMISKQSLSLTAGTASATLTGLTPGPRVLRVECNGHKGLPRLLVVQPGANSVTDRLKID